MQKVLSWFFTPIHIILFICILCGFHLPILLAHRLFGERAMWFVLERMCLALITNIRLTGSRVSFEDRDNLPTERPIIFVCNHQCMYDIPYIIWFLRRIKPRFISKRELGRGLPSISYALRNGSQLLINRKDPAAAIAAIRDYGIQLEKNKSSIVLFPEGTRARDGLMKPFKPRGFISLLETCPSAVIVPLVITGSWEHMRYKFRPVPYGIHVVLKVLKPIEQDGKSFEEIVSETELQIRDALLALGGQLKEESTKKAIQRAAIVAN